jgi:uncharacterized membrane protein YoaK (UPF0700 family)
MATAPNSPSLVDRKAVLAQERLAVSLAVLAGYVDAYGFITYGTYLSFMSGNTTQTGFETGQGNFPAAAPAFLAIVFFVLGVFTGTLLMHTETRPGRQRVFGVAAALLAVVLVATWLDSLAIGMGIATLSLAMGIVNTALSRVGGEAVSLTFVTGTLNKIGSHLALALRRDPLPNPQGPWDTHLRRACLLIGLWIGFIGGAVTAGAATPRFGAGVLALPLVVLLILTGFPGASPKRSRPAG